MSRRMKKWVMLGLMIGMGIAMASMLLADRGRVSNMERRIALLERQLLTERQETAVIQIAAAERETGGPGAIEVSGWFIDRPVAGPKGHYMVRPQIRNTTGRDIQMVEAFVLFRTRTGDIICGMDITRNLSIPAGEAVMEPEGHRVGWERLLKLNLSELRAEDIVADLQVRKVIFADL